MKSMDEIVADFDAIAGALGDGPSREALTPAERALLEHLPAGARTAVDVGCGDGVVTRALARRGLRVWGIDLSPRMVALARARTPGDLDVCYFTGDFMTESLPVDAFDAVVSINMVHHLGLAEVVPRLAQAVAPGGTLLIQDVVSRPGVRYLGPNVAGGIRGLWRRAGQLLGRGSQSRAVAALYGHHGEGETYLTPAEAETAYRGLLPGVRIEHHVEWRYSAIWSPPEETVDGSLT